MSYLCQYVSKQPSFARVTYAASVDAHVREDLAVVWKAVLMEVMECKLLTLLACPEMTTQQLTRVHIPSHDRLLNVSDSDNYYVAICLFCIDS